MSAPVTSNQPAAILDKRTLNEQLEKLNRVCKLAAQARQPLCAINGGIAIIEWDTLLKSQPGHISGPLRDDTRTIIEASELHFPMAVFVTGWKTKLVLLNWFDVWEKAKRVRIVWARL